MRFTIILLIAATPLAAQSRDCDGHFTQLVVPAGLCVRVFADALGPVRQVIVHPSGQVVAALNESPGIVMMSDVDGHAGPPVRFGPGQAGTGIAWRAGWLYFAADGGVVRYRWPAASATPDPNPEWIAQNLPVGNYGWAHTMKGIAVGTDGMVYVSIGSATDECQVQDRTPNSSGRWPCPELAQRAGVWRFSPPVEAGGAWGMQRFAAGLRNAEALAFDPTTQHVWAATMARDGLNKTWGWADSLSANQPAEMLEQLVEFGDYGWPYCQGDWSRGFTSLTRAPEYLNQPGIDCTLKIQPVMGFPGHWSPMAIAVVNSAPTPVPHPGLYIAFHGSRDRKPLPEDGHYLVFVPLDENGRPSGDSRIILHSSGATGTLRPSGVAVSITGKIYVTDDEHHRIYLIEPHGPKGTY